MSHNVDADLVTRLRAALEGITPGRWHAPGLGEVHSDHDAGVYARVDADGQNDPVVADLCNDNDARFIAAAPELLREAADAIEALQRQVDGAEKPRRAAVSAARLWSGDQLP